jgi:Cu+-exporting ATPase
MVYQLLDNSGLCNYYRLNTHPGISRRVPVRKDKFAFLDDAKVSNGLIAFQNDTETHVTFYLPQIHCSSCLYLLEHLHRLEDGVLSARVDFAAKQVSVVFDQCRVSLRKVAELLTGLGYEPYISLKDFVQARPKTDKGLIFQLGVAGFCFANIMLISFPEYLGLDHSEPALQRVFRYLDLLMSLPAVLYSARPFYASAWKGLKHRFLNIDAPIVLAIAVTFGRSVWEVVTGHGSGYFDSLTGIVFFMLLGRVLQDRTYRQLAFDRDYTAYFPVAVTVLLSDKITGKEKEEIRTMPDLKAGDTVRIHSGELIPADGLLTRGKALIDYSFVTGESLPVEKAMGELVYAGGRQEGAAIEILVVREVAQSYLTQLWNKQGKEDTRKLEGNFSFVHPLSRYFTFIVLTIAVLASLYWVIHNPAKIWNTVTAVLIVACPCALFLSSTFTNGNLLRILGQNHFYLRNAEVIERIAAVDHIVFDKTGTLTETGRQDLSYTGDRLTPEQSEAVATLAGQSMHPLSRALAASLQGSGACEVLGFRENPGEGVEGFVRGKRIALGSRAYLRKLADKDDRNETGALLRGSSEVIRTDAVADFEINGTGTRVFVAIDGRQMGYYEFSNHYRTGLSGLVKGLGDRISLSVLSGDNGRERERLEELLGRKTILLFDQTPLGKSRYIGHLQGIGKRVMMIGDGLNDAGALKQSDAGIALTEDCNNFTPASDAILRSDELPRLPAFIRLCRAGKRVILASFALSILYNLIGLSLAVSGALSPMVAAILMPSSSLTILLVTCGFSSIAARRLRL